VEEDEDEDDEDEDEDAIAADHVNDDNEDDEDEEDGDDDEGDLAGDIDPEYLVEHGEEADAALGQVLTAPRRLYPCWP
jgi:hypothetical protein